MTESEDELDAVVVSAGWAGIGVSGAPARGATLPEGAVMVVGGQR